MPILEDSSLDFYARSVTVIYPIADIACILAFLILLFTVNINRLLTSTNLILAISVFTMAVADLSSLICNIHEIDTANMLDPIFSCPYLLVAIAGIYNIGAEYKQHGMSRVYLINKAFLETTRVLFPYLITFSLLIFIGRRFKCQVQKSLSFANFIPKTLIC